VIATITMFITMIVILIVIVYWKSSKLYHLDFHTRTYDSCQLQIVLMSMTHSKSKE